MEILLKGLDDRQIANAVKLQNPLVIDEGEKLNKSVIKKDENNFSTSVNRLMNDRNQGSEIADLKSEVKLLREIIMSLKSQIGDKFNQSRPRRNLGFSRPNQFKKYQDNRNTNNYKVPRGNKFNFRPINGAMVVGKKNTFSGLVRQDGV